MYMTRCLHALLGLLGLFCVPATAVAQISAPSPQSASVIATGTSRSRPLADHLGDTIRAVNFGTCTWDSGHDVAPCIQSAINAAVAARGGDVIVPVGSYELASTLTISTDLVRLVSAGGSDGLSWDDLSHQGTFPTVLTWTGNAGAAMLTIAPPSNTISGQPLRGTGIKGILFNANSIAGYGAQLMSVRAGEFRFGFRDAVMAGVLLDTVPAHHPIRAPTTTTSGSRSASRSATRRERAVASTSWAAVSRCSATTMAHRSCRRPVPVATFS